MLTVVIAAVALFLCWLAFVVGYEVGKRDTADQWRDAAVEGKHAEYYLDAEHHRQWRWLPAPTESEGE